MVSQRKIEYLVGLFLLLVLAAFGMLAFKVSGLNDFFPGKTYQISAMFDDIGGLKVRAPVKIGGVQIGEVSKVSLDPVTFKAVVKMRVKAKYNHIPNDSSAGIYTAGLLGDNYIAITPMYSEKFLNNGGTIEITNSAMVLEKLIGQFMYKIGNSGADSNMNGDNAKHA